MAFDGITVAALRAELSKALTGGRITKIAQPEADELLLTIKNNKNQYRLLISANLSNREQQAKSHDGAGLLHAAAQALKRREDHRYPAALLGADSGI